MTRSPKTEDRWTGALAKLPTGARLMLTAFLAIIGTGYLVAVLNIYHSHSKADGVDGMSLDDIRAVYSGLTVARGRPAPSRMLTVRRARISPLRGSRATAAPTLSSK